MIHLFRKLSPFLGFGRTNLLGMCYTEASEKEAVVFEPLFIGLAHSTKPEDLERLCPDCLLEHLEVINGGI